MILVDTSVWVNHLREGNLRLIALLEAGTALTHPFVIGELACGGLQKRTEILTLLAALPGCAVADHEEVLEFVGRHKLFGRGIGWIDAHLLTSARLSHAPLWTLDRRLSRLAAAVGSGTPTSGERT